MVQLRSIFTTQNIQIMHNPDDKPNNCFILLAFSKLFYLHAIHVHEPWTQHYRWNRIWWLWSRQKDGDSLTSSRHINGLWRCPSIDINVSEQGLPLSHPSQFKHQSVHHVYFPLKFEMGKTEPPTPPLETTRVY